MKNHNACQWLFISLACVGLPACGGLLNSDEAVEHTYWLQPYSVQQSPLPAPDSPGLVVRFKVVPGLDSDRLLTLAPDAELNHVAGARWPDALPEFAGSLIRRSLRTAGWFSRVSDDAAPVLSSNVTINSGWTMASGIPGKPAPVPASSKCSPRTQGSTDSESNKWRETISSGSRTAVKL